MKPSLVTFHELAMNRINTYQALNNSTKFMKLSLMNFHEIAMSRIMTYQVYDLSRTNYELHLSYQVHKNSLLFIKLSI